MSTTDKSRPRVHVCDHCGKSEVFGHGWRWCTADAREYFDPLTQKSACSEACEQAITEKHAKGAA